MDTVRHTYTPWLCQNAAAMDPTKHQQHNNQPPQQQKYTDNLTPTNVVSFHALFTLPLSHFRRASGTSPISVSAALSHSSGSSGAAHLSEESNFTSPSTSITTARTPLVGGPNDNKRKWGWG